MKELLQAFYDKEFEGVEVYEEVKFSEYSVLRCREYNPLGVYGKFDIIAKDGKFYNSNFDNIIEINESTK